MKKILLSLLLLTMYGAHKADAQGLAVNTSGNAANSSAMMDVSSTTQGVLVPRMTATQRGAITGVQGLLVYQTDAAAGFYYYDGAWISLSTSASSLNAAKINSGVVPAANGGAGTANGILKADGSGNVSAATAGTDYLTSSSSLSSSKLTGALPALNGSALTNLPSSGGGAPNLGTPLAKNANYTIKTTDVVVYATVSGLTFTMPSASVAGAGKVIYVMCGDPNEVTVQAGGGNMLYMAAAGPVSSQVLWIGIFVSDGVSQWICVTQLF